MIVPRPTNPPPPAHDRRTGAAPAEVLLCEAACQAIVDCLRGEGALAPLPRGCSPH
ncbi:hypothetical protein C8J29_102689 [Cereibacter johrii]|uniref:Uncharacterized protein n=1 Tax=Cereibacter johrii TaxID=445629 RepID=A0ABX5JEY8_9RHOB|nr:hypothetical protein [Cereibacter johrii]PTM80607.1 hypothetical protein C8J29_102689 [Cereibacter johrii]